MKTKIQLSFAATLLFSMFLITQPGCKKEKKPANQPPSCTITTPTDGQEITKSATVTISVEASDKDGNIAEVRFFIDGAGKGSATNPPYNYSWNASNETIGNHSIKATATDNSGESTSDEITVEIIQGGSAPVAGFTATPTSGTAPLTVNFSDQSTNTPTTWEWDFGDGGTSTQQNPTYTYNNAGTYTVTLSAANNSGSDTKTQNDYISVSGGGTDTFTDPRDGKTYVIVDIGSQTWFAENLNYKTGNSWCYGDDTANCDVYGRLYEWETIMDGASSSNEVPSGVQGVCPEGWHIPSDAEWNILVNYLGGMDVAGGKMKETDTTHWKSPNTGATNESGFTALPGGFRVYYGDFFSLREDGTWWSATENDSDKAWYRAMNYKKVDVSRNNYLKSSGLSVRCLRD